MKYQNWLCGIPVMALAAVQVMFFSELSAQTNEDPSMIADSILLQPWEGPYGGVPPWDKVNPAELIPSFKIAIEQARQDIDRIARNPESPTFENTIVAMEQAGQMLRGVQAIFYVHSSNLNVDPIPEVEKTVAPLLSRYYDSITQNEALFSRIRMLYESDQKDRLSPAQQRLLEDRYKNFVRSGANLNTDQKARLSEINSTLASLFAEFNQRVLRDEGIEIEINDPSELVGIPDSIVAGLAEARESQAGDPQVWVINNTRSAVEPVLTYADNRALREKVWRIFYSRGDNQDGNDTKEIISEILKLRAERANLLGYPTHAHWRLEPAMAKSPENAMELLMQVWPKAVQRVREEVADMQALADQENAGITIEAWDYRYYAEKVRKAKYDLDFNQVKPYLQLNRLVEGMFWSANQLFGLDFKALSDVPVYHPDVRVWEVSREGEPIGLFYFDPFARKGKRSGAWMSAYRAQQNIDSRVLPIISNNCNYIKSGEVALISWDDAVTLFHEFGHGLHGLLSDVQYPSQAGTAVARDYVEFPSQLFEHWLTTPEVLENFARHYQTDQPIPADLVQKIENAATFNQGFATVEYLASALIDMKLHLAGNAEIDPARFERETLAELGMPREMVMRHRTPQFSHVFSSDGYSAGYYSYLWADALVADAAEKFDEIGSYFDQEAARNLYENVLSVGDTIDPAEGFRRFRGRDVDTRALLRKRGFPVGS
jgi:peptidyl-dipeptidase Dcp